MRVEVWLRSDLVRPRDGQVAPHRLAASWEDAQSPGPVVAAERAWQVCSHEYGSLSVEEQRWRVSFDESARGQRLSVGDIVVVGDVALRCEPGGWSPTEGPG